MKEPLFTVQINLNCELIHLKTVPTDSYFFEQQSVTGSTPYI